MPHTAHYFLWPLTDEPVELDDTWYQAFARANRFECGHPDFNARPNPVVAADLGRDVPLSYFSLGSILDVIRRDLREALSPAIGDAVTFGDIIDSQGQTITDRWTLLWKEPRITIRSTNPFRWFCPVCGQLFYQVRDGLHILRSEVGDHPVLLANNGGLVVRADIHDKELTGRKWKQLSISKLSVVDVPRDGLPVDLSALTDADVGPPPKF